MFVLAGQSNMEGRGQPLDMTTDPAVLEWRNGGWQQAHDPLGTGPAAGTGPGMSFAIAVHNATGRTVGIVMCAVGGSSIDEWDGPLYDACKSQIAQTGQPVAGVLFLQGENEAAGSKAAGKWAAKFEVMLARWRQDQPGVPFVLGQIGRLHNPLFPAYKKVQKAQAQEAKKNSLPLVTTSDLPVGNDGVHFTVASYHTLGQRFAQVWLTATQ